MTSSDLAKLLTTRSIARRLCDSWASCFNYVGGRCKDSHVQHVIKLQSREN